MKILYGLGKDSIDVTVICYEKLMKDNIIRIPDTEHSRFLLFTDPLYGKVKEITVINNQEVTVYDHTKTIFIDTIQGKIYENDDLPEHIQYIFADPDQKLEMIHKTVQLKYGKMDDELPEQRIAVRYLTGNERVLELGSNVGRNSMVIAYILKQKNNKLIVVLLF